MSRHLETQLWTAKDVRRFARKIASFGINEIRGNIVIDRTFFKDNGKISGKIWIESCE